MPQICEHPSGHAKTVDISFCPNIFADAPFDKEATLQMVNGGKATISGQVFARNHSQSKHFTAKIQVVNWGPKQVAPLGAQVFLIPYTDYFKEWDKVNEAQRKGFQRIIAGSLFGFLRTGFPV